jgi:hypothetical protein
MKFVRTAMGNSGAGNGINYDVLPESRTEPTVMYSEGENGNEALDFLESLSDQSKLYVTDYSLGMPIQPNEEPGNPASGKEISEHIEAEERGYVVALYDVDEEASSRNNPEIYVAFADQLPRETAQRFAGRDPKMFNGATVEGVDPNLDTEDLWEEARNADISDIRASKKAHKAFRSFVGHTSF